MMADDGLGAAMSLAGARDEAKAAAIRDIVRAASATAQALRDGAQERPDAHDRAAMINMAEAWLYFAKCLAPLRSAPATYRSSDDSEPSSPDWLSIESAGVGVSELGGLSDAFSGGGGDFGGGGSSGSW